MNPKEQLKRKIEEEREKLNRLLSGGGKVEDAYEQSRRVDELIERYIEA